MPSILETGFFWILDHLGKPLAWLWKKASGVIRRRCAKRRRTQLMPADWLVLRTLAQATVTFFDLAKTLDCIVFSEVHDPVEHLEKLGVITLSAPLILSEFGAVIRPDGASRHVFAFTASESPPVKLMVTPSEQHIARIEKLLQEGQELSNKAEACATAGFTPSCVLNAACRWKVAAENALFPWTGSMYLLFDVLQHAPDRAQETVDFTQALDYLSRELDKIKATTITVDVPGLKHLLLQGRPIQTGLVSRRKDYAQDDQWTAAFHWRSAVFHALLPWPTKQAELPKVGFVEIAPSGRRADLEDALKWLAEFIDVLEGVTP